MALFALRFLHFSGSYFFSLTVCCFQRVNLSLYNFYCMRLSSFSLVLSLMSRHFHNRLRSIFLSLSQLSFSSLYSVQSFSFQASFFRLLFSPFSAFCVMLSRFLLSPSYCTFSSNFYTSARPWSVLSADNHVSNGFPFRLLAYVIEAFGYSIAYCNPRHICS